MQRVGHANGKGIWMNLSIFFLCIFVICWLLFCAESAVGGSVGKFEASEGTGRW